MRIRKFNINSKATLWIAAVSIVLLVTFLIFSLLAYPKAKIDSVYNQIEIPPTLRLYSKSQQTYDKSWQGTCATHTYTFTGTKPEARHSLTEAIKNAGYASEADGDQSAIWTNNKADTSVVIHSFTSDTISLSISSKQDYVWCSGG